MGLKEKVANYEQLHSFSDLLGPTGLIGLMFSLYPEETIDYFKHFAEGFTTRRERITTSKLLRGSIDPKIQNSHRYLHRTLADHIRPTIESIVSEEYSKQCAILPQSNLKEMALDKTSWKYYYLEGPTLKSTVYDFSGISEEGIRHEYMLYLREVLRNRIDVLGTGKYSTTIIGINALLEINPSIKRFCQIRKTDTRLLKTYLQTSVKRKQTGTALAVKTMSSIFLYLGDIVSFLTEYYLALAKKDKKYERYIPKHNYFRDFRLPNVDKMANNTISIPDVVMDEISKYKHELCDTYGLMFDIFNWTGLRAKEVELLEEGCVQYDQENDFWYLTANSPKTEKIKRKKGLPSKRIVAVPQSIAKRIKAQEEQTQPLRNRHKTPYIFIKESAGFGHQYGIIRAIDMMKALNKIVEKHNITDENNNLWNFTTRQSRKTFAVKLISNGASIEEVATALGHLWLETAAVYYAEIERMKVADMNTEFFQRKFEIMFGEEQLARFNEQERKQLYLDFCLDFRQVELGVCSRHISQGICDKVECATCNCLCTGPEYFNQWVKMRDQQQQQLDTLLNIYTAQGYENYEGFPEYKRVLHLRNSYQDVINRITGTVRKNNERNS